MTECICINWHEYTNPSFGYSMRRCLECGTVYRMAQDGPDDFTWEEVED